MVDIDDTEDLDNSSDECDDGGIDSCSNGKSKGGSKPKIKVNKSKARRQFLDTTRDLDLVKAKKKKSKPVEQNDTPDPEHRNVRFL